MLVWSRLRKAHARAELQIEVPFQLLGHGVNRVGRVRGVRWKWGLGVGVGSAVNAILGGLAFRWLVRLRVVRTDLLMERRK